MWLVSTTASPNMVSLLEIWLHGYASRQIIITGVDLRQIAIKRRSSTSHMYVSFGRTTEGAQTAWSYARQSYMHVYAEHQERQITDTVFYQSNHYWPTLEIISNYTGYLYMYSQNQPFLPFDAHSIVYIASSLYSCGLTFCRSVLEHHNLRLDDSFWIIDHCLPIYQPPY